MTDLSNVKLCRDCKFYRYGHKAICTYYHPGGDLASSREWCRGDKHRYGVFDNTLANLMQDVVGKLQDFCEAEEAYKKALYELEDYQKAQLGMRD